LKKGQVIAYLMILGGIWLVFGGAVLSGIRIGFIGWFLLNSAQSINSQVRLEASLKGVNVDTVTNFEPVTFWALARRKPSFLKVGKATLGFSP
jgi:hypothetical protein